MASQVEHAEGISSAGLSTAPLTPVSPPNLEPCADGESPVPPGGAADEAGTDPLGVIGGVSEPPQSEPRGAVPPVDEVEEEVVPASAFEASYSFLGSLAIHLTILIGLALWLIKPDYQPETIKLESIAQDMDELDTELVLLDDVLDPTEDPSDLTSAMFEAELLKTPEITEPPSQLDLTNLMVVEDINPAVAFDRTVSQMPGLNDLLPEHMVAGPGGGPAVVDDYGQAFDRITQEILRMVQRHQKVLVVWCFDQSESMKDDQQEIRARIEKVYSELQLTDAAREEIIATAVTSFGENFAVHTQAPTGDPEKIGPAIDAVPVDPSGEEMMCTGVAKSILEYQDYLRVNPRKMMLILVTDESGNVQESIQNLEPAIQTAVMAKCPVYVLGREAVFGYPQALVRWTHPETGQVHLLPVDRGPETAFVEQLQTEGFKAREDAHPSGFGPYAQMRLAWQTGGLFFMLPSVETNIERGDNRKYDIEAMEQYQPDLRSRALVAADNRASRFRTLIGKIVVDLNPYRDDVRRWMTPTTSFSADGSALSSQLREGVSRAKFYYDGLQLAIGELDAVEDLREAEPSKRWKANYDLIRAQTNAYAARVYLYGAALERTVMKAETTPKTIDGGKTLARWRVVLDGSGGVDDVPIDETAHDLLTRARNLYLRVILEHPGTPWAARAEWELHRDFNFPGAWAVLDYLPDEDEISRGDLAMTNAVAMTDVGLAGHGISGEGVGVGTGVGVGVGGGGGGGGGGGVGVGVGIAIDRAVAQANGWGIGAYPSISIVPEYRSPPRPSHGGGGGHRGGGGHSAPAAKPSPPPRL